METSKFIKKIKMALHFNSAHQSFIQVRKYIENIEMWRNFVLYTVECMTSF